MNLKKIVRDKDAMLGLACVVIGIVIILYAQSFSMGVDEKFRTDQFGPTIYPALLGAATALIGLCMFISWCRKNWAALKAAPSQEHVKAEKPPLLKRASFKVFIVFCALFLYWLGAYLIGYLIPTVVFSVLTMLLLEGRTWKKVLSAIVMAAVLYILFAYALQVPITRGLLLN